MDKNAEKRTPPADENRPEKQDEPNKASANKAETKAQPGVDSPPQNAPGPIKKDQNVDDKKPTITPQQPNKEPDRKPTKSKTANGLAKVNEEPEVLPKVEPKAEAKEATLLQPSQVPKPVKPEIRKIGEEPKQAALSKKEDEQQGSKEGPKPLSKNVTSPVAPASKEPEPQTTKKEQELEKTPSTTSTANRREANPGKKEKVGEIQELPENKVKKLSISEAPKPKQTLELPKIMEPAAQTKPHSTNDAKKLAAPKQDAAQSFTDIKNLLKPVQQVGRCRLE